jgi:hypothetical protein
MEAIMKTLPACSLLSLVLCIGFSADALADGHSRRMSQMPQRQKAHRGDPPHFRAAHKPSVVITRHAPPRVVVSTPLVVYRTPRVVVYQTPVVYYSTSTYSHIPPVVMYENAPPPSEPVPSVPAENAPSGLSATQVIGAVAGGVVGSRFGGGKGRLATTAAGAVLGSVLAEKLANDR